MMEAQVKQERPTSHGELYAPKSQEGGGDEIIFLGGVSLSNKDLLAFVENTVTMCCHLVSKFTGKAVSVKDYVATAKDVDPEMMKLFFVSNGECRGPNFLFNGSYLFMKCASHSLVLPMQSKDQNVMESVPVAGSAAEMSSPAQNVDLKSKSKCTPLAVNVDMPSSVDKTVTNADSDPENKRTNQPCVNDVNESESDPKSTVTVPSILLTHQRTESPEVFSETFPFPENFLAEDSEPEYVASFDETMFALGLAKKATGKKCASKSGEALLVSRRRKRDKKAPNRYLEESERYVKQHKTRLSVAKSAVEKENDQDMRREVAGARNKTLKRKLELVERDLREDETSSVKKVKGVLVKQPIRTETKSKSKVLVEEEEAEMLKDGDRSSEEDWQRDTEGDGGGGTDDDGDRSSEEEQESATEVEGEGSPEDDEDSVEEMVENKNQKRDSAKDKKKEMVEIKNQKRDSAKDKKKEMVEIKNQKRDSAKDKKKEDDFSLEDYAQNVKACQMETRFATIAGQKLWINSMKVVDEKIPDSLTMKEIAEFSPQNVLCVKNHDTAEHEESCTFLQCGLCQRLDLPEYYGNCILTVSWANLEVHMNVHQADTVWFCVYAPRCRLIFYTEEQRNKHIREHQCARCKTFHHTLNELDLHEKAHRLDASESEIKYVCGNPRGQSCKSMNLRIKNDFTDFSKHALKVHKMDSVDDVIVCGFNGECAVCFFTMAGLEKHRTSVHQCRICLEMFNTKEQRAKHIQGCEKNQIEEILSQRVPFNDENISDGLARAVRTGNTGEASRSYSGHVSHTAPMSDVDTSSLSHKDIASCSQSSKALMNHTNKDSIKSTDNDYTSLSNAASMDLSTAPSVSHTYSTRTATRQNIALAASTSQNYKSQNSTALATNKDATKMGLKATANNQATTVGAEVRKPSQQLRSPADESMSPDNFISKYSKDPIRHCFPHDAYTYRKSDDTVTVPLASESKSDSLIAFPHDAYSTRKSGDTVSPRSEPVSDSLIVFADGSYCSLAKTKKLIEKSTTPDSRCITPDGRHVTLEDGWQATPVVGCVTPGGEHVTPDGGRVTPDGGRVTPDGGYVTPDGGRVTPDGGRVTPDVGHVTPDGGRVTPDVGQDQSSRLGQNEEIDGENITIDMNGKTDTFDCLGGVLLHPAFGLPQMSAINIVIVVDSDDKKKMEEESNTFEIVELLGKESKRVCMKFANTTKFCEPVVCYGQKPMTEHWLVCTPRDFDKYFMGGCIALSLNGGQGWITSSKSLQECRARYELEEVTNALSDEDEPVVVGDESELVEPSLASSSKQVESGLVNESELDESSLASAAHLECLMRSFVTVPVKIEGEKQIFRGFRCTLQKPYFRLPAGNELVIIVVANPCEEEDKHSSGALVELFGEMIAKAMVNFAANLIVLSKSSRTNLVCTPEDFDRLYNDGVIALYFFLGTEMSLLQSGQVAHFAKCCVAVAVKINGKLKQFYGIRCKLERPGFGLPAGEAINVATVGYAYQKDAACDSLKRLFPGSLGDVFLNSAERSVVSLAENTEHCLLCYPSDFDQFHKMGLLSLSSDCHQTIGTDEHVEIGVDHVGALRKTIRQTGCKATLLHTSLSKKTHVIVEIIDTDGKKLDFHGLMVILVTDKRYPNTGTKVKVAVVASPKEIREGVTSFGLLKHFGEHLGPLYINFSNQPVHCLQIAESEVPCSLMSLKEFDKLFLSGLLLPIDGLSETEQELNTYSGYRGLKPHGEFMVKTLALSMLSDNPDMEIAESKENECLRGQSQRAHVNVPVQLTDGKFEVFHGLIFILKQPILALEKGTKILLIVIASGDDDTTSEVLTDLFGEDRALQYVNVLAQTTSVLNVMFDNVGQCFTCTPSSFDSFYKKGRLELLTCLQRGVILLGLWFPTR